MSTTYAGVDSFPANITLPADNDPAVALAWNPAYEGLADRTKWAERQFKRPKFVALGSLPFVSSAGRFSMEFTYMSLVTSVAAGDQARITIPASVLVHGATITGVEVYFVPVGGHAGLPAVAPIVTFARYAITAGVAPAGLVVLATTTYTPVSLADYNNGQQKKIDCAAGHTIDSEGYVYQLGIDDESGANSLVGARYFAFKLNYVA